MCKLFIFHIVVGINMFTVLKRCPTTLWTTRWVSYKKKLGSFSIFFFCGSVLLFVLFFCAVLCFFVLLVFVLCLVCPKMLVPLDCPFLISTSVFYIAFTVELNFYSLPLNILFYYKLNPLIAWKSYFTIVVVWSQTLKGPPLA
jgi:hypothetical protein